jgi:hypothetical protein
MGLGEWEASAWWVSFLADGLLHSFPQLALSLWFYLKIVQTGQTLLDYFSIASTFLSVLSMLAKGCMPKAASKKPGATPSGDFSTDAKTSLLGATADP